MQPEEIATVETDLFEHREVKPHFINSCCFGEDFAAWLMERLSNVCSSGFEVSGPIQEDYGWGIRVTHGRDRFWIALSYIGDGPTEGPARWVISIAPEIGLNVIKSLFWKSDWGVMETLSTRIRVELEYKDGIVIVRD